MNNKKVFYICPYSGDSVLRDDIRLPSVDSIKPGRTYAVKTECEETGKSVYLIFHRASEVERGRPVYAYSEEEFYNLEDVVKDV